MRWFGTNTDVSEQKRAEESLRESERVQGLLARLGDLAAHGTQSGELIEAIGQCVAAHLGVSRCGFSRVNVAAGQITVLNDYHGHLPSLAGVYPMQAYADHYQGRRARRAHGPL